MKRLVYLVFLLVFLFIPIASHAFSLGDIGDAFDDVGDVLNDECTGQRIDESSCDDVNVVRVLGRVNGLQ